MLLQGGENMNIEETINYLSKKNGYRFPNDLKDLDKLRALMNITMPYDLSEDYYASQDAILRKRLESLTTYDCLAFPLVDSKISLYKGDITLVIADAIVNACNEKMLGCFQPLHGCIDNAIHSYAGLQMRRDLLSMMKQQGHDEPNGQVKVTKGYNLPSSYVFHTVGPKAFNGVGRKEKEDLAMCYYSCLRKANEMKLSSLVFPSISTGVYGFPIEEASKIAIKVVKAYFSQYPDTSIKRVVFCLFSERDYGIYAREFEKADR